MSVPGDLSAHGLFSRPLLRLSFGLHDSPGYRRLKDWFWTMLRDEQSLNKRRFDLAIIALVLLSVGLLIYGVRHPLGPTALAFDNLAIGVFVVEYLLRLWVSSDIHGVMIEHYERARFLDRRFRLLPVLWEVVRDKWRYVSSPLAIIDLLAILPSYRSLRLLRVFLLFRLFKLFRYTRTVKLLGEVMAEKRFEFYALLLFAGFMVIAGSSAIYLFEGDLDHSGVTTLFDAVYWSVVTLSTVGYGDITPVTSEGRLVAMVVIVSGIGVFAFATSLVVSTFQGKLGQMRENRVFSELERRRDYTVVCGYGRVAQAVVAHLAEVRECFVIIDKDPEKVRLAITAGYLAVLGDAASSPLMEHLGLADRASTVLCITDDDVTNVFVTVSARAMNPDLRIIARANRSEVIHKLTLAGADHVVTPPRSVALVAAEYVGRPVAFDAFRDIIAGAGKVVLDGVRIPTGSQFSAQPLSALKLQQCKLVLFGVISGREKPSDADLSRVFDLSHGWFHFNPPLGFELGEHDTVVVFGHEYSILRFKHLLEDSIG